MKDPALIHTSKQHRVSLTAILIQNENSVKPPNKPLCTRPGKVIHYKCIDLPGLIQSDEDLSVVITFHSQTTRYYNTAYGTCQ